MINKRIIEEKIGWKEPHAKSLNLQQHPIIDHINLDKARVRGLQVSFPLQTLVHHKGNLGKEWLSNKILMFRSCLQKRKKVNPSGSFGATILICAAHQTRDFPLRSLFLKVQIRLEWLIPSTLRHWNFPFCNTTSINTSKIHISDCL